MIVLSFRTKTACSADTPAILSREQVYRHKYIDTLSLKHPAGMKQINNHRRYSHFATLAFAPE